ncbi:unnamed protein product [Notodromas monacha]|uniref:RNA-directed DNA polymerase n=1 Tax=Notodromas monacha TaxID=399045 RepID=A0A7R9BUJ0_9CRUS|nr:unnamed protein product [Notodromas monacha]CAG0920619.1 unnamed protein product [Notodromas monacha]
MATDVAEEVGLSPHPTQARISAAVLHVSTTVSHAVSTVFTLGSAAYEATFLLLSNAHYPVILGLDTLKNLPFCVTLDGQRVFSGFQQIKPINEAPTAPIGQGITFVHGTPAEQQQIAALLRRYAPNIFQWSGKHGLFPQHVASLPTNGDDPEPSRRIRLSPDKRPSFQHIIDNYTRAGIIEPAQSTVNSPAFLTPKDDDPNAPAIKRWHLVEDYREINKVLLADNYPMPAFPQPATTRQMQRFLGLATYLRAHVPTNFAQLEKVLRLTIPVKPATAIIWSPEATEAFEALKQAIANAARLERFDPAWDTEIHCDASTSAIGAILVQIDPEGQPHIMEYASRVLTPAETRYSNTQRELLAAVWATTKKFRHYVEHRHFKIITDHKALLGELSDTRLISLKIKLESFNYTLVHRPGKTLTGPDALSRIRLNTIQLKEIPDESERQDIIDEYHIEMGHPSWKRTFHQLRQRYTWPEMRTQIFKRVSECTKCFTFNPATATVGTHLEAVPTTDKHDRLGVDFWGPFPPSQTGNRYALVAVDYYTKRAIAQPVKRATANALCSFLADVFAQLGSFEIIHSDGAAVFSSAAFKRFTKANQMEVHIAQPYHPEGNGACERTIKSLTAILAKTAPNATSWDQNGTMGSLKYDLEQPECPGRYAPGTQLQHRLNIERKFRNPDYSWPARGRAPSKIINFNFAIIRLRTIDEASDILIGPDKSLYLRLGCAPLQRKETEFKINNLNTAPIRRYCRPECPGRYAPGTQLQHRLNIERKFRNPDYSWPARGRAPSKIINFNFAIIRLRTIDEASDILIGPDKSLYLRLGCAPLQRKETEFKINNLNTAPIRRYFDGAYRCTTAALDEILEKWRPNFRLSVVVKQSMGTAEILQDCPSGGGMVVGRGALPFEDVYKKPTQQVALLGIGDGAVQKIYSGEMDLYETKNCTRVIINEFSGDHMPLLYIPFKPQIHIAGCFNENQMHHICDSNFQVLVESQSAHAFLVRPEVVLKREHRLMFNDWMVYTQLYILRGLCLGLHAASGLETPADLLPDEDLVEGNQSDWTSPSSDQWWGTLEEAIRLGPLFQKSDEACACKFGAPGEHNDNDTNLSIIAIDGSEFVLLNEIRAFNEIRKSSFDSVGQQSRKVALLQKKPLYIRDNDRFMVEHLEIFMLLLGFTVVCWTNQIVDAGVSEEGDQKVLRTFDHVLVSANLKFAGVLKQLVERLLEGSPKQIVSREDLIYFLYHPAHEEPLFVTLQSMRDLQTFARRLRKTDPFNCPFTELDMAAIYEIICQLELLLGIPVSRAMSAWLKDDIMPLHSEFRDDAVQIASLNSDEPPPVDIQAYRADTQLRVRLYVQHTRLESPWVNQVLSLPAELDLPDYSSRGDKIPSKSNAAGAGDAASVATASASLGLSKFLPGFDTAAGYVRGQQFPRAGRKQETYEWCISSDEDPNALPGDGKPTASGDVSPTGVLKLPAAASVAAEKVLSTFPTIVRENADKAITNYFPRPAPGWYGRVPGADPVTRVTELDSVVTRATPRDPINVSGSDK